MSDKQNEKAKTVNEQLQAIVDRANNAIDFIADEPVMPDITIKQIDQITELMKVQIRALEAMDTNLSYDELLGELTHG